MMKPMKASDLARKLIELIENHGDQYVVDDDANLVAQATFSSDMDVDGEVRPAIFLTFDGELGDIDLD